MFHIPEGVILAGSANLAISFNIVNIGLSIYVIRHLHAQVNNEVSICASALLVGMILGQLIFGGLGDLIGRERSLIYALLMCFIGAVGSAVGVSGSSILGLDLYVQLAAWRFLLGIGGGGVYPLMATIAKESVSKDSKEEMNPSTAVALTFSMQGFGYVLSPILMLILILFPFALDENQNPTETLWRVHLGFGAFPLLAVMLFALRYNYKHGIGANAPSSIPSQIESVESPLNGSPKKDGTSRFWKNIKDPSLRWLLIGTAIPWLLFDIMFYGNTLFVPQVLEAIVGESDSPNFVKTESVNDLVIKSIALPGYIIAIFVIEKIGPKILQMMGFMVMAAAYALIGLLFEVLPEYPYWALLLYSTTFLFSNLGPNSTTFIMPGLLFKEEVRSSMSGVSGASGKVGAILGTLVFDPLSKDAGVGTVLYICAIISVVSFIITGLFVPHPFEQSQDLNIDASPFAMRRSLSSIKFRHFLKEKFWNRSTINESYREIGPETVDMNEEEESQNGLFMSDISTRTPRAWDISPRAMYEEGRTGNELPSAPLFSNLQGEQSPNTRYS